MCQEGFVHGGSPLQGCCDHLGQNDLHWEKGVTITLLATVPRKPGRGCASVNGRRVLHKVTAPPNTRNISACPSLPYLCSACQLGQAKTVFPPPPVHFQPDVKMLPPYLIPCSHGKHRGAVETQEVAALYQQLPVRGEGQQVGKRNGSANTQG